MGVQAVVYETGLEGLSGLEDGLENIDAAACEGNDGLKVAFSLVSLTVVQGVAVVMAERAEGGLVEDAFRSGQSLAAVQLRGTAQSARAASLR
jgi:hypothetical protein